MTISRNRVLLLLLLGLFLSIRQPVSADYYKYTDSNGVVGMTNNLDAVPKKYRSTMKVIREDKKAPQPKLQSSSGEEAATEAAPAPPSPKRGGFFEGKPWAKPLLVILGIAIAFFALLKITKNLASAQLANVIYIAFFLGVSVFLYKSYTDHLVDGVLGIKQKVMTMFKKANVREVPMPGEAPPEGGK